MLILGFTVLLYQQNIKRFGSWHMQVAIVFLIVNLGNLKAGYLNSSCQRFPPPPSPKVLFLSSLLSVRLELIVGSRFECST